MRDDTERRYGRLAMEKADGLAEYFDRREIWQRKPQIRLVYERWVRRLCSHLPAQGPFVEVGSGSGVLEDLLPEVIRTDVIRLPWMHCALDCMHMPFLDSAVGAIIGLDLLHHVAEPHAFLREAARTLRPDRYPHLSGTYSYRV